MTSSVLILHPSPGHGSGAERVLEYLLAGLPIEQRRAITLVTPASSTPGKVARDLGCSWIEWPSEVDSLPGNARAAWHFLRGPGARPLAPVVHSWHTRHLEWAWAIARLWSVPAAGTLHDDPNPAHHQFGPARKRIIRLTAHHLDGVVAVSQALADRCRHLGWQCPVRVIRNGLPEADSPAPASRSAPLRIGFLGTTVAWKGLPLLPALIDCMRDAPVQWNLFGKPLPEVQNALETALSRPRVRHFGSVPLSEALSQVDVLLHLSTAFDPYPTVLLEAARAGLPCVATAVGGAPEIVSPGHTGLLIPPGDVTAAAQALESLAGNSVLRQSLAAAARIRYEQEFRVDRMVADYFSFWDGLRSGRL